MFTKKEFDFMREWAREHSISVYRFQKVAFRFACWLCQEGRFAWIRHYAPFIPFHIGIKQSPIKLTKRQYELARKYSDKGRVRKHRFIRAAVIFVMKFTSFSEMWNYATERLEIQ